MASYEGRWTTVRVDVEEGIGWVTLNRPDKRNAMSPTLNAKCARYWRLWNWTRT